MNDNLRSESSRWLHVVAQVDPSIFSLWMRIGALEKMAQMGMSKGHKKGFCNNGLHEMATQRNAFGMVNDSRRGANCPLPGMRRLLFFLFIFPYTDSRHSHIHLNSKATR